MAARKKGVRKARRAPKKVKMTVGEANMTALITHLVNMAVEAQIVASLLSDDQARRDLGEGAMDEEVEKLAVIILKKKVREAGEAPEDLIEHTTLRTMGEALRRAGKTEIG